MPPRPLLDPIAHLLKWALLGTVVGLLAGASSAAFLHALAWATAARLRHPWLLDLLPIAGGAIGWIYARHGREVERGGNLILERIHEPGPAISAKMAPLIALGTVATHLCGGSAGREGTAVQMGAGLADLVAL